MLILKNPQGQDCFVCKRRGHHAKDCPYKNKKVAQCSEICLRCGETGHVMLSCRNDYSPNDLKVNSSSKPSLCIDYHFLNSTCVDIHAIRGINKAKFFSYRI